jgi:glycosidase
MGGHKPDERIRTPMRWDPSTPSAGFTTGTPWQPLSQDPASTNVETQALDEGSLLSTYRSLVRLRADHPALAHGEWLGVDSTAPTIHAFVRHAAGQSVLVVANLSTERASDVSLTLEAGPLCGAVETVRLFGPAPAGAPEVTAAGGFEDYVPFAELAARETAVFSLVSK